MELHESIHLMFILLAHVMRGAGTFSLDEKIKMIQFIGYIIQNTTMPLLNTGNSCGDQTCKTNHSNAPRIN